MELVNDNINILYTFDTDDFIKHNITPIVLKIRNRLALERDTDGNIHSNYRGLCFKSVKLLKEEVHNLNNKYGTDLKVKEIHGEQKHSHKIDRSNWYLQHSWAVVYGLAINDVIYVDITSQQFQGIYDDIPDYYISLEPPVWYLPDSENRSILLYDNHKWFTVHIYDELVFYIWGGICNLYRKLMMKK